MIRTYHRRGKKVEVEQVQDLLVMKLDLEHGTDLTREGPVATWQGKPWYLAPNAIPPPIQRLWENAGWNVVRPGDEQPTKDLPLPLSVGSLLRDERGEWMIGTSRLTVRLNDDLAEEEALKSLEHHDLRVIRQLTFAPHLYEVQVSEDSDCFDVASQLSASNDVSYAEPQLIKHLGGR